MKQLFCENCSRFLADRFDVLIKAIGSQIIALGRKTKLVAACADVHTDNHKERGTCRYLFCLTFKLL